MDVELTIVDHYSMETRVVVHQMPVVLGRDETADVYLKDPWASHRHCSLSESDGLLVVSDLGSKNGVFLHGHRVSQSHILPGEQFAIGRTEITVHYQRAAKTPPEAAKSAETAVESLPRPVTYETLDLLYGDAIDAQKPRKGDGKADENGPVPD